MLKNNRFYVGILLSLAMIGLTSCVSVKYPNKQQYLLQASNKTQIYQNIKPITLTVQTASVSPQFSNMQFVYRTGKYRYTTDFYHVFFISPGEMLQQLTAHWLYTSKLAIPNALNDPGAYLLRSHLNTLYADYQDRAHPKAVMSVTYALIQGLYAHQEIRFSKIFTATTPLTDKTTQALVVAWNQDMIKILTQLTTELYATLHPNEKPLLLKALPNSPKTNTQNTETVKEKPAATVEKDAASETPSDISDKSTKNNNFLKLD